MNEDKKNKKTNKSAGKKKKEYKAIGVDKNVYKYILYISRGQGFSMSEITTVALARITDEEWSKIVEKCKKNRDIQREKEWEAGKRDWIRDKQRRKYLERKIEELYKIHKKN